LEREFATIADVAKEAGVNKSTASRVLNQRQSRIPISQATVERVRSAAARLHYMPNLAARALTLRRTHVVAAIMFGWLDPNMATVLQGVQQCLEEKGYDLFVAPEPEGDDRGLSARLLTARGRADGLLIFGGPHAIPSDDWLLDFYTRYGPVVAVMRQVRDTIPEVTHRSHAAAKRLVLHLLAHGRRRVAVIAEASFIGQERLEGCRAALQARGLSLEPSLVTEGDWTTESGYEAMRKLLKAEKFDGLFAVNDRMAFGAIQAAHEAGLRVPQDLGVVGFDNQVGLAEFCQPPLTTAALPFREMGEAAARLLLNLLENRPIRKRILIFGPTIIIRASCGCPNKGALSASDRL